MILITLRISILDYIISQAANLYNRNPFPAHSVSFPLLHQNIEAARQNLGLSPAVTLVSPYTFHSFHFIFSAAIAIAMQSLLVNETTVDDELRVNQAVIDLDQLGKMNESAAGCAKMVRDLRVVAENVKMVRDGTRKELAELVISPAQPQGEEQYWSESVDPTVRLV